MYRLADLGFFRGQRAERIGGQIVVQSPQNWRHAVSTDRAGEVLRTAFGPAFWVRTQLPLELGLDSDPEPDVSVIAGKREDFTDHPRTAVLVVEVSDSSLSYDRTEKASLYAAAGIADYWVIDVAGRRVEVFRSPQADGSQPFGAGYASVTAFGPGDALAPLAGPGGGVPVGDLLP
jgi:Uma2 family endonuclease